MVGTGFHTSKLRRRFQSGEAGLFFRANAAPFLQCVGMSSTRRKRHERQVVSEMAFDLAGTLSHLAGCRYKKRLQPTENVVVSLTDYGQSIDYSGEALRCFGYRQSTWRFHQARRVLRERPIRPLVGGWSFARINRPGRIRGKTRQMDLRPPAHYPPPLWIAAD